LRLVRAAGRLRLDGAGAAAGACLDAAVPALRLPPPVRDFTVSWPIAPVLDTPRR
jgi:hypothetical protein